MECAQEFFSSLPSIGVFAPGMSGVKKNKYIADDCGDCKCDCNDDCNDHCDCCDCGKGDND